MLYLLDRYPELSQTFVSNEVRELRRCGVAVRVVALTTGNADGVADADEILRPSVAGFVALLRIAVLHPERVGALLGELVRQRGSHWRMALFAVAGLAEKGAPSRVHTHFAWSTSTVAIYAAVLCGSPVSITVHARDIFVFADRLQAKLRACDVVVTVCEYNRRWLHARGMLISRLEVVPCGVELPALVREPAAHPHTVIGVGRLVEKKGFDLLVRAAALVRRDVPELAVRIVGEGPERARLESLIHKLDLDDCVTLVGALSHPVVLDEIAAADIFVLPCRVDSEGDSDAMPMVIREAMARAVPVLSTRVGGIPETVVPGTGWLCEPEDAPGLATELAAALTGSALATTGGAARSRIATNYTLERTTSRLRQVLEV